MRWPGLAGALVACLAAVATIQVSAEVPGGRAPDRPSAPDELSTAQIVERNVAARGGIDAWRKVQTMVWAGRLETTSGPAPLLPFVLEQKRPDKSRFEVTTSGHRYLRLFDGEHGWRVHPGRDGKPLVEPYAPQEIRFAQEEAAGIDGVLIDHAAKGIAVALDGIEDLGGRKTYRLGLRLASGQLQRVWVDAQTFLDMRYDRISYDSIGTPGTVSVYYGDYQPIDGLQIPHLVEIGVGTGKVPDKMVIERVTINAPMDEHVFALPRSLRSSIALGAPPIDRFGKAQ